MKKTSEKKVKASAPRPPTKEQEYLLGWKRARAELLNLQRRVAADREADMSRLKAQAIEPLLPIADNFGALAQHVPEDMKENSWAQGVLHIARQLDGVLRELGVEVISPEGEEFNPLYHEAVEEVEGEKENIVAGVVQIGYRIGETILRPAKVKVSK